ncbi:hypothetical protein SDC9_201733 [bioreactor metagenome]|uniref:Uncharacterized protein n=1 Tax=bioreactor metagenome TaxID=1076179 RepID=A0A645J0N1_9ZZZZ
MSQGVGIPAGNGVEEEKFQRLMVGKACKAGLQKAPAHLFPMSVMDAHGHASLAALSFQVCAEFTGMLLYHRLLNRTSVCTVKILGICTSHENSQTLRAVFIGRDHHRTILSQLILFCNFTILPIDIGDFLAYYKREN